MDLIYKKIPYCYGKWYNGKLCLCSWTDKLLCQAKTDDNNSSKQTITGEKDTKN